jgi:hypothetical protein
MTSALQPTACNQMFREGAWSQRNHPIPSNGQALFLSMDDLYRACLNAARQLDGADAPKPLGPGEEHHSANAHPGDIWFNVEAENQLYIRQKEQTRPEQMPTADDGSLLRYAERMSRMLRGKSFCFRVTDIHCFDIEVFRKCRRYLAPLLGRLGEDKVSRLTRTALFVGDYAYSPFGSHMDPDPQFQYVIHGRRTAHIWTPECWKREPRNSLQSWRYLDEAETFDLQAGEAIYWPAGHYHVFTSHGLSVAVTFAFADVAPPASAEERRGLPSKHGFYNCPVPVDPPPLAPGCTLRGHRDLPVVLLQTEPDAQERIIACNGHLLRLPAMIDYAPIVARINDGVPFACSDITTELHAQIPAWTAAQAEGAALQIVRAFASTHALDVS